MYDRADIFIIVGEPSGDMIGSLLVKRLLRLRPELRVCGLGGEQMAAAGAEILIDTPREYAFIGLSEVVRNLRKILGLFRRTTELLERHRPKVVVLIDYPGFNLRIAKTAARLGCRVVYYVTPQVWAWKQSRAKTMRKYVEKALVIFPFEEGVFRKHGIDAEYVGHPLIDIMILTMSREEVFAKFGFDPAKKLIGLLPGSRRREVDALLPTMLEAAGRIHRADPDTQFVVPRAANVRPEQLDRLLLDSPAPVRVVDTFRYNVRSALDFAIVASGTATLETGLLLTPQIIVYKVSALTWFIGKRVAKVRHLGLVNIVADKEVALEMLQDACEPEGLAAAALAIMRDPARVAAIKQDLGEVKEKMGGPGASERAALRVLEVLDRAGKPEAAAR